MAPARSATRSRRPPRAGAADAIVFNQGNGGADRTDLFAGTLGAPQTIPAISVSCPFGQELSAAGTTVSITTQTVSETRPTWNVLAELAPKNAKRPARRSSSARTSTPSSRVPASTTTAPARARSSRSPSRWQPTKAPANPVRFAFWGAEESGLLGSEHYVASLSAA